MKFEDGQWLQRQIEDYAGAPSTTPTFSLVGITPGLNLIKIPITLDDVLRILEAYGLGPQPWIVTRPESETFERPRGADSL